MNVLLQQNSSRSVFGGIGRDCERGREIREVKDWLGNERSFQCSKGIITRLVSGPGMGLLGEIKEEASSICIVGNEALIEVCEP